MQTVLNPKLESTSSPDGVIHPEDTVAFHLSLEKFGNDTCVVLDCGVEDKTVSRNVHYRGIYERCLSVFPSITSPDDIGILSTSNTDRLTCPPYPDVGQYVVTATAYDITHTSPDHGLVVPFNLLVTSMDCTYPRVVILDGAADFLEPTQVVMSESVSLQGRVLIECEEVKVNEKVWRVWHVDPATGQKSEDEINLG